MEVVIVHSKSLFQMFYFSDTFFVLYHSAVMQFNFHAQKLVFVKKPGFFCSKMLEIRKQYWGKQPISKFILVVLGTLNFFCHFFDFLHSAIFFLFFRERLIWEIMVDKN